MGAMLFMETADLGVLRWADDAIATMKKEVMGKDQELLEAARNGQIEQVGKLLDKITRRSGPLSSFRRGTNINTQDVNGYTPLHHACLNGHASIVRLLLAHDATPDLPDIRGSTPLYLAAWAGHQEIVKLLLMHSSKPANPNAHTIDNETPVHCAAQHGHNTALAILLAYGADPTIRNNSFQTALDLAAQFGRLQAVQMLIRTHPELIEPYRHENTLLGTTCEGASSDGGGSSPPYNTTPTKHIFTHTCLHLASRNGHKKVVEALLAAGVDVNILTNAGTALHEAALCGKKSVVATLLHAGVDPSAVDGSGRTALDLLKDFPPHVTYEIASVINDFFKQRAPPQNVHFQPIPPVTQETANNAEFNLPSGTMRDKSHSMPLSAQKSSKHHHNRHNYNRGEHMENTTMPKTIKSLGHPLSSSMSSLEQIPPARKGCYVKMKPILPTTAIVEPELTGGARIVYQPVYQPKTIDSLSKAHSENNKSIKIAAKVPLKRRDYVPMTIAGSESESYSSGSHTETCAAPLYRSVDDYVKMSKPYGQLSSSTANSLKQASKKPLPSPRRIGMGDYANVTQMSRQNSQLENGFSPKQYTTDSSSIDTNNNAAHSPTPEYPPPSATEAVNTILELIQTPSSLSGSTISNKRKSLHVSSDNEDLESFIMETINQLDSPATPSSRQSDYVEEFVGDEPFAGLFKGSIVNLSNEYDTDDNSGLRSPSLVRSIKPVPRTRNLSNSMQKTATKESEDSNEAKIWAEINAILEHIGVEVSEAELKNELEKIEEAKREKNMSANEEHKPQIEREPGLQNKFKLRKPADLLLGITKNLSNTNWCHAPNKLINEQILYEVYYLGSTIIRKLQGTGTISARKSIQKLKCDEATVPAEHDEEPEVSLIEGCNNSTKFLKDSTQQRRLKVVIAISYAGVKFMDSVTKATICIHDIQNINCVSQDADDLRYFAYITKENDINYCHIFMVDNLDLAREIILTLGQAFEVAYQIALIKENNKPIMEEDEEEEEEQVEEAANLEKNGA